MEWRNLTSVLNAYKEHLEAKMKDKMPSTWQLRNTFSLAFNIDDVYFEVTFKADEYWKYANEGRAPGRWPPKAVIDDWIRTRNITPTPLRNGKVPTLDQLSFLIRRKIGTKGTGDYSKYGNYAPNGIKFYDDSVEETQQFYEKSIEDAIMEDIVTELDLILLPFRGQLNIK